MHKSHEAAFVAEAATATLAKEHAMPMIIGFDIEAEDEYENKAVLIDAKGNVV